MSQSVSIVIPVYNEAENIAACLRRVYAAMRELEHEILVCYDFDADTTLPAIAAMPDKPPTVRLVKNTIGKGAANALRAGFAAALGDVVVTTMADLSDPPETIPAMAAACRAGADVVAGSRYMEGGAQLGGPVMKGLMSRTAGWLLYAIAGLGTRDATNNFRAYRKSFLDAVTIESKAGFEIALELTVKAHNLGYKVAEVPSTWTDRTAGESRFQLLKWLPNYLRWFFRAASTPALVWASLIVSALGSYAVASQPGSIGAISAFVAILLTLTSCGIILASRAVRGRLVAWDALHPVLWFGPFALGVLRHPYLAPSLLGAGFGSWAILVATAGFDRFIRSVRKSLESIDQKVVGFLILVVALWLNRFRMPDVNFNEPTLDDSWRQVFGYVLKVGARIGHDIVFTHGPFGYFKESPFDPDLYFAKTFLWEGLLKFALAIITLLPLTYIPGVTLRVAYFLAVFIPEAGIDGQSYTVIAAALGWILHNNARITHTTVLVVLAVAILTLVKFTFFVVAGLGIAVVIFDCILNRQLSRAIGIAITSIACFAVAWIISGQSLLDIPAYVRHSLWISSGYNHAMVLRGELAPQEHAALIGQWLGIGLLIYIAIGLREARRWTSALLVVAYGFLVFKASFVRQMNTPVLFFTTICSIPIALVAAPLRDQWIGKIDGMVRLVLGLGTVVLGIHGIGIVLNFGNRAASNQWMHAGFRVQDNAFAIGDAISTFTRDRIELQVLEDRHALPRIQSIVGDQTIDVFGNRQGYALLNNLNYQPRPVFQSYSAYTRDLMQLNANYYASERAPQFVLLTGNSIDDLIPNLHDSLAFSELLRRYRARTIERGMLLMERDPSPRPAMDRPVVFEKQAEFEEWIEIPESSDIRIAEIHTALTRTGRIQSTLFKVPHAAIDVRLSDGTGYRFGFDIEMAKIGFLLDPWVSYWAQLRDFMLNRPVSRVSAVRITVFDEADRPNYYNSVKLTLRRANDLKPPELPPEIVRELIFPMFDPKPTKIETRLDPSALEIEGRDAYLVHSLSKVRFDLAPGPYNLRALYGLMDSSWQKGVTDGATFAICAASDTGSRTLCQNSIDPRNQEADRGPQRFWLEFVLNEGEHLELIVDPGPNQHAGADWAYWSSVVIAKSKP